MHRTAIATLGLVTAATLMACAPPQADPDIVPEISTVRYVAITAAYTVADCVANPGGAVVGQGESAYCRIVP